MSRRSSPSRGAAGGCRARPTRPPAGRSAVALLPGLAVALTLLVPTACGDGGSGPSPDSAEGRAAEEVETISRETFISAYVDLRITALRRGREAVTEEERREVLERHGITEDDLLEFVEVHGEDVDFMRDLWEEVDRRIGEETGTGDSPSPSGSSPVPRPDQRTVGRTTPMLRAS